MKDVEYIGFCHYRRFFGIEINKDNINSLLSKTDVIAIKMPLRTTVYQEIVNFVSPEDLTIFLMVLSQRYPEYEKTVIDFLWGNEFYSRNMLICKKELFDQYAQWIFGLLSECEEYVRRSPYSRGQRAFAYLGEYFMSVFMICYGCRIKTVGFVSDVSQIGQKRGNRFVSLVRSLIKKTFIRGYVALIGKPNCLEDCFSPPVLVGLANDGIAPLGEKSYELASQKDHS